MSYLNAAKKPAAKPKPPIITIIGSPGSGKTSFAGTFPKAIFIQAEDAGTVFESWDESVQPTMMPILPKAVAEKDGLAGNLKVSTFDVLMAQLRELATAEHDFPQGCSRKGWAGRKSKGKHVRCVNGSAQGAGNGRA